MALYDNQKQERKDARKSKAAQPERRVRREDTRGADWGEADPAILAYCIGVVAKQGGALRFGYSRDGGAFSIGIYGDGEQPYTEYVRPSESIDGFLRELAAQWGDGE